MPTYRIWPSATGSSLVSDSTAVTLGVEFYVTQTAQLNGYYWWCPAGGDTTAKQHGLYTVTTGTTGSLVTGSTVTTGTLSGGAWNYTALSPSPLTLTAGQRYRAAVYRGASAADWYSATASGFPADITNGILICPSTTNATGGIQGSYVYYGALTYPSMVSGGANYWIDVSVSTTAAVVGVGTPLQARATSGSVAGTWNTDQPCTAGDTLVACVTATAATSTTAIATTSGWAKTGEAAAAGRARVAFYTQAAAGADAAPTFTSTLSGTGAMTCTLLEFAGMNTTTPVCASGTATGTTAAALTAATTQMVPPLVQGCYALSGFTVYQSPAAGNAWTADTGHGGWTNVTSDAVTSSVAHSATDYQIINSGAAGAEAVVTETGTWGTAGSYTAGMIIVVVPQASALAVLSDNFNTGTETGLWGGNYGPGLAWTGGGVAFTTITGSAAATGFYSAAVYDMTGSSCKCQLTSIGAAASIPSCAVQVCQIYRDLQNTLSFYINGGNISAATLVATVLTLNGTVAFDPAAHMWQRIRESAGTVYWDVSPNNITWTNFYSTTDPFTVTAVLAAPAVGTTAAETARTTVTMDNVGCSGLYTSYYLYQSCPAAGTQNLGVTAPTGQKFTAMAVEIPGI